ncbi:short-chain dehydrogenase/reductase SDR [Aspergillus steynii IBT 23096]|uniref:Short-chain dehydrogenase/reductase SDR n=1 Tax=Aspergillus steynii IBT 23096 TaxID=1392250 RepID=A0A2I2G158_9EURO|nr:short-chain dehydrogenase/reductase SDR [Aspergillus steynii IBT 23096]PLB46608.1 short-chain dehydrogenase/reductase SDR [Aspergillus steynii IBT 23096]
MSLLRLYTVTRSLRQSFLPKGRLLARSLWRLKSDTVPSPGTKSAGSAAAARQSFLSKLSLDGKVTMITGGARGIGLAIAEATATLGSDVILFDVLSPQAGVEELQKRYGTRIKYYRANVTQQSSLEGSFTTAMEDFGRLDNCITAAGVALDKPFLDHQWDEARRVMDVNVLGSFFPAQLAARQMVSQKSGGNILMIASIAAHCAVPAQCISIYGASKAAITLLGKTLGVELGPYNIRVNTLSPGFISTDMLRQFEELQDIFARVPSLGRIGETDDLMLAIAYLLSDGAKYTTGADLPVTGGLHGGRIALG